MKGCISGLFAELLGKSIERFPRFLAPDVQQFFVERPAQLTSAIELGLTEWRKKVLEAERTMEERRRASKRVLLAQVKEPVAGMDIDFGHGWYFTVDEVVEFPVIFALTTTEFLIRCGLARNDFVDLGTPSYGTTKKVKAILGRFSKQWTEASVSDLLATPGCRFKGSGAWVLEGFIEFRPKYDGKGLVCFVGDPNSRWKDVHDYNVFFPCLYGGVRDSWRHGLDRVDLGRNVDDRLCFLWE
jgi:hypothetical protein